MSPDPSVVATSSTHLYIVCMINTIYIIFTILLEKSKNTINTTN